MLQMNWRHCTTSVLCPILILLVLYVAFFYVMYSESKNESLLVPSQLSQLLEEDHSSCNLLTSALKETNGSVEPYLSQKKKIQNLTIYRASDRYNLVGIREWICWHEQIKLENKFEKNIEIVKNYPIGDSASYLNKMGLGGNYLEFSNPNIPVLVTAASSNHFYEVQGLMKNIHTVIFPIYKKVKFIFYDIGLSKTEKKMIRKHCRCEFRLFPFEDYPAHVQILTGYTFKPLIVQKILNEFGFVFWIDASVRLSSGNLDSVFKTARNDDFLFHMGDLGIGYRTDPVTFKFLKENPCLFADKNEIWGTLFLMHRSRFTVETIMRPWVSCALTLGCMFFNNSQSRLHCGPSVALGGCHRFDQSVIGIILWRLYHNDSRRFNIPEQLVQVKRGQNEQYVETLEMKKQV